MSNIPEDRLGFDEKPFTNASVDYLGSYHVKLSKRSRSNQVTAKRYIDLFICLTMMVVHLEIASDLSGTSTKEIHLQKERSKHNKVRQVINFVAASKELKKAIKNIDQSSVSKHL